MQRKQKQCGRACDQIGRDEGLVARRAQLIPFDGRMNQSLDKTGYGLAIDG
jgi:hypothetical protein